MRLVAIKPDCSAPGASTLRPTAVTRCYGARSRSRSGFTMVELLVVVAIIAIVAALTIPNITRRMRERRASEAAQRIAQLYQTARTQAMGRGTAVLVRYSGLPGAFEVKEAQRGPGAGAGCAALPDPSCIRDWNTEAVAQFRPFTQLDLGARGEYEQVTARMLNPSGANHVDVCFTPMGRTFARLSANGVFLPLTSIYRAEVARMDGTTVLGVSRTVMILPTGGARVQ